MLIKMLTRASLSSRLFKANTSKYVYEVNRGAANASAAVKPDTESILKILEPNPAKLNLKHLGRFFSISDEDYKVVIGNVGFTPEFRLECETFRKNWILVRKPYIDIVNCIQSYDLRNPVLKFVLHGQKGNGKSIAIGQLAHYGFTQNFILVYVPWSATWRRYPKETVASQLRPNFIDHTTLAVNFLTYFRTQNSQLLTTLGLKTSKEYSWGLRESTKSDVSLLDIVEHGISRPIHASECIHALIAELKIHSSNEECKTMVLLDGVNSFYHTTEKLCRNDKSVPTPEEVTAFEAFKQVAQNDWNNGILITSVDASANTPNVRDTDLPRYLLTKKGFEAFDPFVPVHVEKYTPQEVQTIIDFYIENHWLAHPEAGSKKAREELEYISVRNPMNLRELCKGR